MCDSKSLCQNDGADYRAVTETMPELIRVESVSFGLGPTWVQGQVFLPQIEVHLKV